MVTLQSPTSGQATTADINRILELLGELIPDAPAGGNTFVGGNPAGRRNAITRSRIDALLSPEASATNLDTIEQLSTFETEDILTRFLAGQSAPGGFLAPAQQQEEYGVAARGILDQLDERRRTLRADTRGLNPAFARRAGSVLDYQALRDLLSVRQATSAQTSERRFQAGLGLANAAAAQDVAEKGTALGALQFSTDIDTQLKVGRQAASATKTAGFFEAVGSLI